MSEKRKHGKLKVFTVVIEGGEVEGIQSQRSMRQLFSSYLNDLEDGDDLRMTIQRKDMSRSEINNLPEL